MIDFCDDEGHWRGDEIRRIRSCDEVHDLFGAQGIGEDGEIVDPTGKAVGQGWPLCSEGDDAVKRIKGLATRRRRAQNPINPDLAFAELIALEDEVLPGIDRCSGGGQALWPTTTT